jgi:hypothetical protein
MCPIHPSLEPKQLSDLDIIPAVWGVLEIPRAAGPHPGVILLPGSSGLANFSISLPRMSLPRVYFTLTQH